MTSNIKMDRRSVLAILGSAGLGLAGAGSALVYGRESEDNLLNSILPNFTDKARETLSSVMNAPGYGGQIPAAKVKELMDLEGKDLDALMVGLLPLGRTYARPPISQFFVGAVARGVSGNLYFGGNVEFAGMSLGSTVHAEQAALSNAYMHSDTGVSAIAVTAVPCGHCRQFMSELSPDGQIEILLEGKSPAKLSSMLPMGFGRKDAGFKGGVFPVKEVDLALSDATSDELLEAALKAARKSYARYTGAPAGVALATQSGRIYKGSYIETAAFNPSLSPLQIALVGMILAGEDYSAIRRVVLAEVKGAKISQRDVTEAPLRGIAPAVQLQVSSISRRS